MENQEAVFVGCVMGWESDTDTPNCCEPCDFIPPVVTEFCAGHLQSGKIQPTGRMIELAVAGFMPIAIVYRGPGQADCYFLFAHNSVSEAVHQQLVREAEAIFKVAADSIDCNARPSLERVMASCRRIGRR